jgi:hypothetical protein
MGKCIVVIKYLDESLYALGPYGCGQAARYWAERHLDKCQRRSTMCSYEVIRYDEEGRV